MLKVVAVCVTYSFYDCLLLLQFRRNFHAMIQCVLNDIIMRALILIKYTTYDLLKFPDMLGGGQISTL